MTENEAIEILNYFNEKRKEYNKRIRNACPYFNEKGYQNFTNSIEMAMSALSEIQQYRAIGTVKQIERGLRFIDGDDNSGIIEDLRELHKYYLIGTVEECREARERRIPKEPNLCMNEVSGMFVDYADGHGEYKTQINNWWRCPCCNEVVGQRVVVHKHIHDQRKKKFCEKCGQAIDWSE